MKKIASFQTLGDLKLSVSRTEVKDVEGIRYCPDEVVFLLHGYDPSISEYVESHTSISLEEAQKLVDFLNGIINYDKNETLRRICPF